MDIPSHLHIERFSVHKTMDVTFSNKLRHFTLFIPENEWGSPRLEHTNVISRSDVFWAKPDAVVTGAEKSPAIYDLQPLCE
jgi:hypothetical protein